MFLNNVLKCYSMSILAPLSREYSKLHHHINYSQICKYYAWQKTALRTNILIEPNVRSFSYTRKKLDHYEALEITPKATQAQVKQAYYRLSMVYHPDQHGGDHSSANKFREVKEAYEVLGNVHKRKLYDRGFKYSSVAPSTAEQKYAKTFYGSRNKEGKRAPMTGKTAFYDFDEWYGLHYQESASKKKEAKLRREQKASKVRIQQEATINLKLMLAIFFVAALFHSSVYYLADHDLLSTPKRISKEK